MAFVQSVDEQARQAVENVLLVLFKIPNSSFVVNLFPGVLSDTVLDQQ